MTPDDKLKDAILNQTLNLFRLSAGEVARVHKKIKAMEQELIAELSKPLDRSSKKQIKKLLRNSEAIIKSYYGGIQQELDLGEVSRIVASKTGQTIEVVLGVEAASLPLDSYFASVASNVMIEGSPAAAWWSAQEANLAFKFAGQVRQGLINAETNQQIITRIVGTKNKPSGIMEVARRDAASLVQTSVQTVANDARLNVFRKNSDVIAGVRQVSTLDSHTSLICVAYSEQCWDLNGKPIRGTKLPFNGGCPRHFNCRSVLVPITKTFRELGVDIDEPKPTTRASDEGPISAKTDFDAFLKRKGNAYADEMLGHGRADLWRKGKITLRDLVNGQGRPLTTDELRNKFANK